MVWGIIAAIIAVATSAASYMQAKKAEKLAAKQAEEMAAVQISGHNNNRSLYTVYGQALLGSTVVWKKLSGKRAQLSLANFTVLSAATGNDLISQTSHTPKRYLYRAVTLCNGPVEAVTNVLIDGESYQSSRFKQGHNRHFGAAISLGPTAGLYYSRLRNYSVTDFGQWDNTKVGKGVCHAMERLYLDKDNPAYQGEPTTQYLVKGRLLYDPRLDSTVTGGSGTHRSDNSSTWAYSDNPVLALLDYVTNDEYGRGLAYTNLDLASIIVCANACDVLVDIPARLQNSGPGADTITIYDPITGQFITVEVGDDYPQYHPDQDTTTNKQKRYRINTAIDGSKEILDNIQQILNVFKGNFVYVNGKYTVTMADVANSVLSITDDDIIGGLTISDGDRSQRMNRATVKFINANKDFKTDQVSWPEIGTTEYNAYLAEDQDEKLHRTFTIDGCTNYYQAEDTAEFIVRDGRSGLTVSGTFGSRALALTPGDVIAITYDSASYSGKFFRVQTVALNIQTMNVNLTLREYDSSVYTWNANKGNEPLGFSWHEEPVNLSPTSPSIGTVSTTTHDQADSTAVIVMTVPFTGVPAEAHRVEVSASVQNENKFTTVNVTDLPTETSAAITLGRGGVTYDVRVRYIIVDVNGTHLPSAYVRTTHAVPALASAIGTKVGGISDGATANIIYRQDEPPTGTDHNAGDQWFDTNDGNKVYVWSGSNWVSVQDDLTVSAVQPGDSNVDLGVRVGSGSSVFTIDSSGVYLGSETFSAAPFKVAPDGAATATKLTVSGTSPTISIGTDATDTVTLSTASDHRMWVGSDTPESANFKIHKDGTLTAKGMHLQDGNANAYFGVDGFTDLAYSQIASNIQSRVNVFESSGTFNPVGSGLSGLKVNLTTNSSLTISARTSNLFSGLSTGSVTGGPSTSTAHAISKIPDNFTLALQKSTTSGTSGFTTLVTQTFTKVTSGSTSASTYLVESTAYVPPGTTNFATPAQVNITNHTSISNLNADGDRVIEHTATYASGVVYFRVLVSTTDTSYDQTVNAVSSNWPRVLSIKDNGATGFIVVSDNPREITQAAGTGDITSVSSGTNLTGGATSGAVTLDLASTIAGDHTFSNNLQVQGNLTVNGTTNYINTDNLNVKDKNITINYASGDSSSSANGAGITIQDAVDASTDATLLWDSTNDKFDFSHKVTTPSLDVGGAIEFNSLSGTGAVSVTDILNENNMSSNSATALATQASIKAYVLANANTGSFLPLSGGTLTGGLTGTTATFSGALSAPSATFGSGTNTFEPARTKRGTATINNSSYAVVAKVLGDNLGSSVQMSVNGTSGNVVINTLVTIMVSHSLDITVESTTNPYTRLFIKIISDGNEDFDIYLMRNDTQSGNTSVAIEIMSLNNETVFFTNSTTYSTTTHIHETGYGKKLTSTGGTAVGLNLQGVYTGSNFHTAPSGDFKAYRPSGGTSFTSLSMDLGETANWLNSWSNKKLSLHRDGHIELSGTRIIDSSRNLLNIGNITASYGGDSVTANINITNTLSNTFNHSLNTFAPNLTTDESNILVFGRAGSTKNAGYIGYLYSGTAGSNNNKITLGHWGSNHLVTIDGVGNTTFTGQIIANKEIRIQTTDDQNQEWYLYTHTDDSLRINYNGSGADALIFDTSENVTFNGNIGAGGAPVSGYALYARGSIAQDSGSISAFGNLTAGIGYVKSASGGSGGYYVASQQVIDGSRNLTNIGTISSGAITSSGNLKIHKTGDDSVINVDGNSGYDPVVSWRSDQQSSVAGEGFQIWYDNSVGDVHLHTTYANDVAAIRFHTRTGTDKATNNERFTINGNGNINIVSGTLLMGNTEIIDASRNISAGTISSADITITSGTNGTNTTGLRFINTDNPDAEAYIKKVAYYLNFNANQNEGFLFSSNSGSNILMRMHGANNSTRPNSVNITASNGLYINNTQVVTSARVFDNVYSLRVAGGGSYVDAGSQMYIHTDASGHGRLAVYDMVFNTGGNNARTGTLELSHDHHVNISSGNLKMGATTVITSARAGALTSAYLGGTGSLGSITTNKKILLKIDGGFSTNNSAQNKVMGFIGTTNSENDIFSSTYQSGEFLKNFYLGLTTDNSYFNASRFSIVQGAAERFRMAQGGNSTFYNSLNILGPSTSLIAYLGGTTQSQYSDLIIKTNSGTGEIFKAGTGYTLWGGASALNIFNSNEKIAFHPSSQENIVQITSDGLLLKTGKKIRDLTTATSYIDFDSTRAFMNASTGVLLTIGTATKIGAFNTHTAVTNKLMVNQLATPQKNLTIGSSQSEGIQFNYDTSNNYRNQILNYWNSNADTRMDFNIARTSGQTPVTIMSVGYNSNVGISTTTPAYKLDIRNDVAASTDLDPASVRLYNNSDGGAAILFENGVSAKSKISFGVEGTGASTDETFIGFSTGQNTAMSERLRINSSGSFDFKTNNLTNINAIASTGIASLTRGNGSVGAPNTANHDTGTRIELYNASATAWYAIGIESNTMWFNSDAHYRFYTDAVSKVDFDSSGVVNAVGGYKVNGTTVIDSSRQMFASAIGIGTTSITDTAWGSGNAELAIDGTTRYGVIHLRGTGAGSTDTRYSMGVGDNTFYMAYDDVAGVHRAKINTSKQLVVNDDGNGDKRVFHDAYHPNADKWTTARTLTLSGNVTGSVTFDGSAAINMTNTVVGGNISVGTISSGAITPTAAGSSNTYAGVIKTVNTSSDQWGHITFGGSSTNNATNNYYMIGRGTSVASREMSFHIPNISNYGDTTQPKFRFASTGADTLMTITAQTGAVYIKGTISSGAITATGAINSIGTGRAIQVNGTTRINSVGDIIGTSYYVGGTNVIDTSRNLTNIGTISSGAITSTGSNASTSDWVNEGISSKFVINAANRTYGGLVFKDSAIKGAGVGFRYDGTGYKLELGTASSTSSGISTHLTIDRLGAIVTSGHLDVGNELKVKKIISPDTTNSYLDLQGTASVFLNAASAVNLTVGTATIFQARSTGVLINSGSLMMGGSLTPVIDASRNLLNIAEATTSGSVLIGGTRGGTPFGSGGAKLLFSGGSDAANYFIGTTLENVGGNYSKLDLRWHTGIRMGAQGVYGGIRFYNNEDLTTKLLSIGEGSGRTDIKVYENLLVSAHNDVASGIANARTINVYGSSSQHSSLVIEGNVGTSFLMVNSGLSSTNQASIYSNHDIRFAHATNKNSTGFSEKFRITSNVNQTGVGGVAVANGMRLGFDQSGVRSWMLYAAGGNFLIASGDGNGAIQANNFTASTYAIGANTVIDSSRNIVSINSLSALSATFGQGATNYNPAPVKRGTANITQSGFTMVANVNGDKLGSAIKMTVTGTSGSVVVNVVADIQVGHYQDITVTSTGLPYTPLYIRIVSNGNEDFDILLQKGGTLNSTTAVDIEIFALSNESITFTGTTTHSSITHTHYSDIGIVTTSTGGTAAGYHAQGIIKSDASLRAPMLVDSGNSNNVIDTPSSNIWRIKAQDSIALNSATATLATFQNGSQYLYGTTNIVATTNKAIDISTNTSSMLLEIGNATQTQYTDIQIITDGGNAELFKGGINYTSWGGSRAFNVYNSSGDICFHPSARQNVVRIKDGGGANNANITITNVTSNTFNHTIESFATNLNAGEYNLFVLGRAGSTKNSGYLGYKYSSAGSNNNLIVLGHWGSNDLLTVDGVGNTVIEGTINSEDIHIKSGTGGTNTQGLLFTLTDNADAQAYIKKTAYYMHYNAHYNEGHRFTVNGTDDMLRMHGSNNGTRPDSIDILAGNGLYMNSQQVMTSSRNLVNIVNASTSKLTLVANTAANFEITASGTGTSTLYFNMTGGNQAASLSNSGNMVIAGTLTQLSDRRIKDNITPITDALSKTCTLQGSTYTRTDAGQDTNKVYAGLIAQDVEAVLPEAIGEKEDMKTVNYSSVIALLVESIKELKSEVDDLKTQLSQKEK